MAGTSNNWFYEYFTPHVKFGIELKERLAHEKSAFQEIDFYDSYEFGRFFTLDGYLMLTERDEFIYHEMIAHVPMAVCTGAKRALIVGGGDGGAARELLKYKSIERVDAVEVDEMVVNLCKEYMDFTACSYRDPRVNLIVGDGVDYVKNCADSYDIILVDSTDPVGIGEGLFSSGFYADCARVLSDTGVLINQHESPYYENDAKEMVRAHQKLRKAFPIATVYQFHMPTYASGHWLFGFASKGADPISGLREDEWNSLGISTQYYNTRLHKGCFSLPNYVLKLLDL